MITVHRIRDLTAPGVSRETSQEAWGRGAVVRDYVPSEWTGRVHAVLDGRPVSLDEPVPDGTDLSIGPVPAGIEIGALLINLAISAGLSYAAMALQPKPEPPKGSRRGRTSYTFANLENVYQNGAPVPAVYGLHRVAGTVLALFAKRPNDGGDSLWMLMGLGEGEFSGLQWDDGTVTSTDQDDLSGVSIPDTILINGNKAQNVRGSKVSFRTGTTSQTHIPDFSDAVTSHSYNTELGIWNTVLDGAASIGETVVRLKRNSGLLDGDELVFQQGDAKQETGTIDTGGVLSNGRVRLTAGLTYNHSVDSDVRKYEPTTFTPGVDAEAFDVNLHFPSGLYRIKANGNRTSTTVVVVYRYRLVSGPGAWSSEATINVEQNKTGAYRHTERIALPTKDEYEIEMWRRSVDALADQNFVRDTYLDSINTVVHDAFIYPHTALLGVKAVASRKVNGGAPTVTALARGRKVRVYTVASPPTYSEAWMRNPAWIALDMLRNNRFGGGAKFDESTNLDPRLQRWIDWASYCDEWVLDGTERSTTISGTPSAGATSFDVADASDLAAGDHLRLGRGTADEETVEIGSIATNTITIADSGTLANDHGNGDPVETVERRHMCDIEFADDGSLWERVQQVAACGRGTVVKSGNQFWPWWDRAQDPVQVFSSANISPGSFQWDHSVLGDAPNAVDVQFLNADRDYESDLARVVDPDALANQQETILETVSLPGVTRMSHADREAWYHLRRKRLIRDKYQWDCGLEGLLAEPGDLVLVQHPTIVDGKGCRAGTGSTSSTLVLDSDVTIAEGETYMVRIHHASTDTTESVELAEGPGTYTAGTALAINGTWTTTPAKGSPVAHGALGKDTIPVVLQSVTTTEDLARRVVAFNYDPSIYEDQGLNSTVQNAGYGGGGAVANNPPGSRSMPSAVSDLATVERIETLPDSTATIAVDVSWTPPENGLAVRYDIYIQENGDTHWRFLHDTRGTETVLRDVFTVDDSYEVAVVPIGPSGAGVDPEDATSDSITIAGPGPGGGGNEPPPFGVTVVDLPFGGNLIRPTPTAGANNPDGLGSVDYWEGRLGGWRSGIALFRGRQAQFYTPALPPSAPTKLYVRGRSKEGIWSEDAVVVDLSSTTVPGGTSQVLEHKASDDSPSAFQGTKTNMAVATPWGQDPLLQISAAATEADYTTQNQDAGATTGGKNRVVWVSWEASGDDEAFTVNDWTFAVDHLNSRRRTVEGRIDESGVSVTPYVAGSDDTTTWTDWVQADRPVQLTYRYYKTKLELSRTDTDEQLDIAEVRTYVVEED